MIPEELRQDVAKLHADFHSTEISEDGTIIYVQFIGYHLPPLIYNKLVTDLLVLTTPMYPRAGFDMFWTDPDLTLANGNIPSAAGEIETYLGRQWRRFSYHPYQNRPWDPSEDSLVSFLSYIAQRLARGD